MIGPTGQGISRAEKAPLTWSATENVAWKVRVPGRGWSSPVLAKGRIYLTTATGEEGDVSLRALCFDANDPLRLAPFWAGVLGWEMVDEDPDEKCAAVHQRMNEGSDDEWLASLNA